MPSPKILRIAGRIVLFATLFSGRATAADPPDAAGWSRGDSGMVIVQANWGRRWPCAGFENAQLVSLEFRREEPSAQGAGARLDLKTPGMLRVDDSVRTYAYLLLPGTYTLSGFEIKAARSARDVGRIAVDSATLTRDGRRPGGFRVEAGEIVYIGGFGLDCAYTPIPWRYYLDSREAFDEEVARFRRKFPFTAGTPVRYRLFESDLFAEPPLFPEGREPPIDAAAASAPDRKTDTTAGPESGRESGSKSDPIHDAHTPAAPPPPAPAHHD